MFGLSCNKNESTEGWKEVKSDKEKRAEEIADWILGFLASGKPDSIVGKTKFVKLLFLLDRYIREKKNKSWFRNYPEPPFEFEPNKYGPYDEAIDEALDILENQDFLVCQKSEKYNDAINIILTDKGKKYVKNKQIFSKNVRSKIKDLKQKYADRDLMSLLFYIYNTYPEMAKKSDIKDKVNKQSTIDDF